MTVPNCPRCSERGMVELTRTNRHDGATWWYCRCCSTKILTDKDHIVIVAHK